MHKKNSKTYREAISKKCKNKDYGAAKGYLIDSTPAKIRRACLQFFTSRNSKNDMDILNRFFQFPKEKDPIKHIRGYDLDKFKPVKSFLNGKTTSPKDEVLDLIAWLLDFTPRPYYEYSKFQENENSENEVEKTNVENNTTQQLHKNNTNEKGKIGIIENSKRKNTLIIIVSILVIIFITEKYTNFSKPVTNSNQCMVWEKTKYVKISCNKDVHPKYGTKVIPMDKKKMETMKKVVLKRSDSIVSTEGKPLYWYCKIKSGKIAIFTTFGLHPVSGKPLKHLTEGIFKKYVPIHINNKDDFIKETTMPTIINNAPINVIIIFSVLCSNYSELGS